MTLTDEQIAEENKFLKGLPRLNVAALLLPPIWGPAHGFWATILFYPMWVFVDNMIYAAFTEPTTLSVVLACIVLVVLLGITVAFSIVSQPIAAHRAEDKGVNRKTYLRRQKWWALGCAIGAVVVVALATYYNLEIRPTLGA